MIKSLSMATPIKVTENVPYHEVSKNDETKITAAAAAAAAAVCGASAAADNNAERLESIWKRGARAR